MFDPRTIPILPTRCTPLNIVGATFQSLAMIRFGRKVRLFNDLRQLYRRTFDLELAICQDFCAAPAGWVEHHAVRLPVAFTPMSDRQIRIRLERMIHAPRDIEAADAILAAASYVTTSTSVSKPKRKRLIRKRQRLISEHFLDRGLVHARVSDPTYVDALLNGHLDRCMDLIATGGLVRLQRSSAIELLLTMARLWMLHDLQVIAARLHQSIYQPTNGFIEGFDAGPQSFQSFAHDPVKMGEMAEIASRLLKRKPGHDTLTDLVDEKRFWGFVTATGFKKLAREIGLTMGFTAAELDDVDAGRFGNIPKIAKVLRYFTTRGAAIGAALEQDLQAKWDDRAPITKNPVPKSVSHLSASAIRNEIDAPAALAHAIIAFIELSDQLPDLIGRHLGGDQTALRAEPEPGLDISAGNHKVTFELMFAAYRAIFLRDQNYLREELSEMLPCTVSDKKRHRSPIFASNATARKWRQDFILGQVSTVSARLGADAPSDGLKPKTPTNYGADSLAKALAIIARNRADGAPPFDPRLTPAILWRLTAPSPP